MVNKIETVIGFLSNSVTTSDFEVAGFGAAAGAEVWISGTGTQGTEQTHATMSYGFWDGTTQRSQAMMVENGTASTNTWKTKSSNKIGYVVSTTGSFTRTFTIAAAPGGNGIRITASSTPAIAYLVMVKLYGGAGTQCKILAFTGAPAVGGGFRAITGVGFMPDLVKTMGDGAFGSPISASVGHQWSVGAATRLPIVRNVGIQWLCDDADATSDPQLWASESDFSTDAGINGTNRVSSFDADGVTIFNAVQNGNAPDGAMFMVKMPGYQFWCGAIQSPTGTGVNPIPEPNFRMVDGSIIGTAVDALDIFKTDSQAAALCMSTFSSTPTATSRAIAARIKDAATTQDTGTIVDTAVVQIMNSGGPPTSDLDADWNAWTQYGMDATWGTVRGTSRYQLLVAAGPVNSLVPKKRSSQQALLMR